MSSLDVELKTAHFRPGEALYLAMANVDVDWAGAADAQEKVSSMQSLGKVADQN